MTTSSIDHSGPTTLDEYFALDEDLRRETELIDGVIVPREQRGRKHQKTGFRLAEAIESAVAKLRRDHQGGGEPPCTEVNTEVDVVLWEVPPTVRKPDVVVHHCLDDFEELAARDVLIVIEVVSRWSESRDRIHKMGEYAKARIPHYFIVEFDGAGARTLEHYALLAPNRHYSHLGTTHRDQSGLALDITDPFPLRIQWNELETAPRT
jgi:Uma2 family endonuclease